MLVVLLYIQSAVYPITNPMKSDEFESHHKDWLTIDAKNFSDVTDSNTSGIDVVQ